jgi:3'-phosphoadenosine 5'-phosphosulfate sulfotransferase (PAPS reductase)/FAD synthetase
VRDQNDNKTVDWVGQTVKCVVPVSGGKDSQTCLALAVERFGEDSVIGLFCDTQFEHPFTYEHIENMKDLYDVEIVTRTAGSVLDQCLKWGKGDERVFKMVLG